MVGQYGSMVWVHRPGDYGSASLTLSNQWFGSPRDTFAEIALTAVESSALFTTGGGVTSGAYAVAGISQVVSNEKGTENFNPPKVKVFRKGMKGITFTISVGYGYADARWMLNFWS